MSFVRAFAPVLFLLTGVTTVVIAIGGIDIAGYSIGTTLIVVGVLLCVLLSEYGQDSANASFLAQTRASTRSNAPLAHWLSLILLALVLLAILLGRCGLDGLALTAVIPQGIELGWTDCSWSALPVWSSIMLGLA